MKFLGNPLYILTMLCLIIVISEWLVRATFCRHFGTALVVILVSASLANLQIIPTASDESPLYAIIFEYLAPLSIFYLLLGVNLRHIKRAGAPMLLMFLVTWM